MATKKYLELQEFSDADLQAEIESTQTQFQKLKFDHSVKGLDNPLQLREVRRDVARLLAEDRRRQLKAMTPEEIAGRSKIRRRRKNKR